MTDANWQVSTAGTLEAMPTLVRDPPPPEFEALARTAPTDGGLHRDFTDRVFYPTAALVIEIVSPGDESWGTLDVYAGHRVEELLIVDPQKKTASWLGLEGGEYRHLKRSRPVELGIAELAKQIDWP
jgi:hypothetical protein